MNKLKVFLVMLILATIVGVNANSQSLLATSDGDVQDTMATTSSNTNTSDFVAEKKPVVYMEYQQNSVWNTVKVEYPMDGVDAIRATYTTADSTIKCQVKVGGIYIDVPIINYGSTTPVRSVAVTLKTGSALVRFRTHSYIR